MLRNALKAALLTAAASLCAAGLTPVRAQTLEAAIDASPAGLDPHIITAFASFMVVNGTIYEGLTAIDKDLRVGPGLAESWTVAPDGKTYNFKLRSGVTFHNGAPMEAADVAASLKRVMAKEIASPLASRLAAVDSVTAPDATTVELKLKEPAAPLLTSLATLAIVPRSFEADKDGLQKQPVGTGPFKFREWQPNGFIALSKNDAYWRKDLPKLDGVKFNIVPESATRQVGVSSGQYAMLPNIDAATALQLKGKPGVKLSETLELAYTLIGFNVAKPPFDNAKVREAVNTALNRDEIIQAALFGAGVPGGPLSPALKDWATDVKQFSCYKHDPAKAKQLLKESGVAQPISVTMTVLPRQDIKDIAQVVQQQLGNVGIKVELKTPELGQFIQDWRNGAFDLFASTNAGSPDPDDYFFRTFRTGGSTNVFKYTNPELDALLDKARANTDPASRKADYAKVQSILACDGPIAHLAYGQLFTASRANVSGYEIMANRSLSSLAETAVGK
ncbi:ABC transporter substrate-binding protein [Alsobacter metallidurans]|uniref:ABC transporter substrate-binding protein n=1 Tax=Alsobacter metallidurans TaxID=340221 RepID=A0A917I3R5_9HYPH|nr:ABC transporter substrate-binding protein [Alsobacter metallidurans]GGH09162.1 ABC transporter substrate-binding protein [Alsobacter metallidurans]